MREKSLCGGGGGGWLRVNLVLRFGPNLSLRLWIWTWTKLNNILFGICNVISSVEYVNIQKVPAYLVSYDMFKAYDRVMLS